MPVDDAARASGDESHPDQRPADAATRPGPTWYGVAGVIAVLVLTVGWFLMSYFAMDTDVSDALGESVGAGLGLLIALSVVGAVVSARTSLKAGRAAGRDMGTHAPGAPVDDPPTST
jgi:hypothetical protein